jgi:hypothetical protein
MHGRTRITNVKPLGDRQNHGKALSFTGKEWLDTRSSMSRFPTRPRVHSCEGASVHDDMPYADSEGLEKSRIRGHEKERRGIAIATAFIAEVALYL